MCFIVTEKKEKCVAEP